MLEEKLQGNWTFADGNAPWHRRLYHVSVTRSLRFTVVEHSLAGLMRPWKTVKTKPCMKPTAWKSVVIRDKYSKSSGIGKRYRIMKTMFKPRGQATCHREHGPAACRTCIEAASRKSGEWKTKK